MEMNNNKIEQVVLECLKYINKTHNLNIEIVEIKKDNSYGFGAMTSIKKYNNNIPCFSFKYERCFCNVKNDYKFFKMVMFQFNLSTGLNMKTELEYCIFTILHEISHMYREHYGKSNYHEYMVQNYRIDNWVRKQQSRNKNTAYIKYHASARYRRITEEKYCDKFAKENLYGCMEYLRNKGVI